MNCIKCNEETNNFFVSKENIKISICDNCLNNTSSKEEDIYKNKIEELIKEFSKFMSLAEKSKFTNKNKLPLKVRKQSILLREILKKFRQYSLDHEKKLNNLIGKN